ncbi:MAG: TRAP transporter TatT component family protein [Candidatus Aminicenantes bacterium]|nr:TRAP transporter TatT component family protein [Candidatus Aminicenantes bacterium]
MKDGRESMSNDKKNCLGDKLVKTQKLSVFFIGIFFILLVSWSCSPKKLALKMVADALSAPGGGTVFTGDNDPELVGDALPFAIKFYESLLQMLPHHQGLQLRTGSLYVMYANAFLDTPADMLPEDTDAEYDKKEFLLKRAKNLYLRGRDMLLAALEKKHPGFLKKLENKKLKEAVKPMKKKDIDLLYWAGAGWMGAFAIDPFDMKLGLTLPQAAALIDRVNELDKNYGAGAVHDFYILYYGSLPEYMGGDLKLARKHFEKAVAASGDKSGSPYISLATTAAVNEQNAVEFKKLLNKVLKIDVNADPENRLLNTLNRRKAKWLLAHVGDFILLEEEENEKEE